MMTSELKRSRELRRTKQGVEEVILKLCEHVPGLLHAERKIKRFRGEAMLHVITTYKKATTHCQADLFYMCNKIRREYKKVNPLLEDHCFLSSTDRV